MALYETPEEIAHLVRAFEQRTLPPDQWTHAVHLAVALWYLHRLPAGEAAGRLRDGLQAYHASRGVAGTPAGGYHETITLFYIRIVGRYLHGAGRSRPLPELFAGLMRDYGHKKLLAQYYSRPLLQSDAARTGWVAPDLQPFG